MRAKQIAGSMLSLRTFD